MGNIAEAFSAEQYQGGPHHLAAGAAEGADHLPNGWPTVGQLLSYQGCDLTQWPFYQLENAGYPAI
jgi:hypothetical protein